MDKGEFSNKRHRATGFLDLCDDYVTAMGTALKTRLVTLRKFPIFDAAPMRSQFVLEIQHLTPERALALGNLVRVAQENDLVN